MKKKKISHWPRFMYSLLGRRDKRSSKNPDNVPDMLNITYERLLSEDRSAGEVEDEIKLVEAGEEVLQSRIDDDEVGETRTIRAKYKKAVLGERKKMLNANLKIAKGRHTADSNMLHNEVLEKSKAYQHGYE